MAKIMRSQSHNNVKSTNVTLFHKLVHQIPYPNFRTLLLANSVLAENDIRII